LTCGVRFGLATAGFLGKISCAMPGGDHPRKRPAENSALGDYPLVYKRERLLGLSPERGPLVALGSAAVLVVYAAGFARTNPAVDRSNVIAIAARAVASGIRHFKDGTYTGWGSCPHGDLEALVVIRHGRIVAASVAQCFTRYPGDVIAQLPAQVIARQSANIDQVSRATESSDAFIVAVTRALTKAQ
jgi:uncharacterized protein with FMN-binding domain